MLKSTKMAILGLVAFATTASTPFTASSRTTAPANSVVSASAAAPMNACDKCEDIGTVHIFQGFGAMMDCVAFNSCHGNTQSGYCGTYHWGCGAGGETQAAEIAAVAASDDPAFIEDYLKEHKASAYYNPDRSVIQRIDCGGSITAQFPVSAAVAAALN